MKLVKDDNKLYEVIEKYNENNNYYVVIGKYRGETTILVDDTKTASELDNLLEANNLGIYDIVFNDEYTVCVHSCNGCNNFVKVNSEIAPIFDGFENGYVCNDCAKKYVDYVLENYKNDTKALPQGLTPKDLNLVKANTFTLSNSNWHNHLDDDPKDIITLFNNANIDVYFNVYPSMFQVDFDVYVKPKDLNKAKELLDTLP